MLTKLRTALAACLVSAALVATPALADAPVANDGSSFPSTQDDSSSSGASLFGFAPARSKTESATELGDADVLNNWIGVVPQELAYAYPSSSRETAVVTSDLKKFGWPLKADGTDIKINAPASDFDPVATVNSALSRAQVAIDLNRDGLDEIATVSCSQLVETNPDQLTYQVDIVGSLGGETACELARIQGSNKVFRGNDNVWADTTSSNFYSAMIEPNRHHVAAGDVNGDGNEDLVLLYYGDDGPVLEVFYFGSLGVTGNVQSSFSTLPDSATSYSYTDHYGEKKTLVYWSETIKLPTNLPSGATYSGFNAAALLVDDLDGDGLCEIYAITQAGVPLPGMEYAPSLFVYGAGEPATQSVSVDGQPYTLDGRKLVQQKKIDEFNVGHIGTFDNIYAGGTVTINDGYVLAGCNLTTADLYGDGGKELVMAGLTHEWNGDKLLENECITYFEWHNGSVDFSTPKAFYAEGGLMMEYTNGIPDDGRTDAVYKARMANGTEQNFLLTTRGERGTSNWAMPVLTGNPMGVHDNLNYDQVFLFDYDYPITVLDFHTGKLEPLSIMNIQSDDPSPLWKYIKRGGGYGPLVLASTCSTFEDDLPGCEDDSKVYTLAQNSVKETLSVVMLKVHNGVELVRFDYEISPNEVWDWLRTNGNAYVANQVALGKGGETPVANPAFCFGNFDFLNNDADSFFLKLRAHEFLYSEPVVDSVIQAPPYFQEIYDVVGSYDSGSTWLATSTSSSTSEGGSASVGATVGLNAGVEEYPLLPKAQLTAGISVSGNYNDTLSRETQFTVTVKKGEDAVVVAAVPIDLYIYDTVRPGKPDSLDTIYVKIPSSPVVTPVPVADYDASVSLYNAAVDVYNAENHGNTLNHLPKVSELTGAHTLGDPATYREAPSGLDTSVFTQSSTPLELPHTSGFGTSTVSLTCTWKDSTSTGDSTTLSFSQKLDGGFLGPFNITTNESLATTEGQSIGAGTSYRGEVFSIPTTYDDYRMNVTLYAGTVKVSEQENPIKTVGYVASDVEKGIAPASSLRATGSTDTSITLEAGLPFGKPNSADLYSLERKTDSGWEVIYEFVRPVVTADTPDVVTCEYVDEGLTPETSYTYRVIQSGHDDTAPALECTATTAALRTCAVTFPEYVGTKDSAGNITASGFVEAWAIDSDTGSKMPIVSPAKVIQGTELRFLATPVANATLGEWKVTEDGVDITNDLRVQRFTVNGDPMLTVTGVAGDIAVSIGGTGAVELSAEAADGLRKALFDASAAVDSGELELVRVPELRTGWVTCGRGPLGTRWLYFDADGSARRGWLCDGGTWYYLDPAHEATMSRGWAHDGSGWYLFGSSGAMKTGWQWVGGKCYYLSERAGSAYGRMAASTVVDGWRVGPDGAWVR